MESRTVFRKLRAILSPYSKSLVVVSDSEANFYLDTHHVLKNGKPLFFAAVRIGKNYVSYHLMPVYVDPGLLSQASNALRKRMHGKSCFNFKAVDDALLVELSELTRLGFDSYVSAGYIECAT